MSSVTHKKFFSSTGVYLLLSMMFSRKAASRLLVGAFNTRSTHIVTRGISARFSSSVRPRWLSTQGVARVDEDLDAALDNLLGSTFDEDDTVGNADALAMESQPVASDVEEINPEKLKDPTFLSTSNPHWVQAGLSPQVIDVLSEKGIVEFTPVQAEAFGPVLSRRDVIGRSRTGTGKTLAFGLPALTRLNQLAEAKGFRDDHGRLVRGRPVSMVVLCPTRELARQVQEELSAVARPLGLYTEVFHGGVSYDPQARALRQGLDILVGTPGRIIDHMQRGNLNLSECDIIVLDEADEMLNMGFADDVEVILDGLGENNDKKPQCLLFSATTPPWVTNIGRKYQEDVVAIDATGDEGGARVAKTVRHMAVQVPPGAGSKNAVLEDIIAVEISKDKNYVGAGDVDENLEEAPVNEIAAAAAAKKEKTSGAMQQKIFGKTIVFTETKRQADELVSGGIFKSLSAQALHGDVGQKQRDATLAAFRAGAFNVLVATDVAARGIDIKDVDLVIQFDPPRDVDTYVHRSGRTGRAGQKGVSVLLFDQRQQRDIVRIERDLGHGFKFDLTGPPSIEAALRAAAKTSAVASTAIPDETAKFFMDAAASLLAEGNPENVVARCLAAISRRSIEVQSRSLITGELGLSTVQMSNSKGTPVSPGDVMFTVGKLSRMSRQEGDLTFDSDVGKIQANPETGVALFDMGVEDAKRLIEFSKDIEAGGAVFSILETMEIERGRNFGRPQGRFDRDGRGRFGRGGRGGRGRGGGGRGGGYRGGNQSNRGRRDDFGEGRRGGGYGRGGGRGGGYGRGGGRGGYDGRSRAGDYQRGNQGFPQNDGW
ncbi:unnamed protein product [Cylindrotheca closterium]|uniref:RNA helicase n=1 Tax=Cylindrotheca closterium TaxID=2856 RepID=A0AAD2JKG0_9STRA|nr:unnamed protein product [Cylindrotheca closterium]